MEVSCFPGTTAVSCKKSFPDNQDIINPLLDKFVLSRWQDSALVLFFFFFRVYGPRLRLGP